MDFHINSGCALLPVALFYQHGLMLIPEWISNYIHHKVWDEIACPFQNITVQPLSLGLDK